MPIVVIAALFVVSDIFVIKTTAGAGRHRDAADGRGHRPPVVVGGPLPRDERGHRERDPHPGAHAGARRGAHRGRDPQLLGAAAEPEDRHDPGPDERGRALRRHAPAATAGQCAEFCGLQHAHMALYVFAAAGRGLPALARAREPARDAAGRRARRRGARSVFAGRALLELPRDPRHGRERRRRARPHPPREPDDARRGDDPEPATRPSRAGSPTRSTSSPGTRCPTSALPGRSSTRLVAYLEGLK